MIRKYKKIINSPNKNGLKHYISLLVIITFGILLANLLLSPISYVLQRLIIGLIPFFIAVVVVFILKEPRKLIANKLLKKCFNNSKNAYKIKMNIALIIVFILFLALIVGIFWLIVPKLISVIQDVVTNLDTYISKLKLEAIGLINKIPFLQNFITENTINSTFDKLYDKLVDYQDNLPQLISQVGSKLLNIFNLTLIGLIFAFLILLNLDKYKANIIDYYQTFKTPSQAYARFEFIHNIDRIFVDYGFSKLIEGIIILMSVTIGLIITKSSMPFELALFMAFLNVIPYVGPIIALIPILFINAVLTSINIAFVSMLVAILIVIFVTTFITPLIVGKKIKIDIFMVLLSLTIGGALFGALGMVLAPPIMAIILYSIKNSINNKKLKNNLSQ